MRKRQKLCGLILSTSKCNANDIFNIKSLLRARLAYIFFMKYKQITSTNLKNTSASDEQTNIIHNTANQNEFLFLKLDLLYIVFGDFRDFLVKMLSNSHIFTFSYPILYIYTLFVFFIWQLCLWNARRKKKKQESMSFFCFSYKV